MADATPHAAAGRANLADVDDFELGGMRICPARREVRFGEDRRELEPQVMKVLVALAAARPQVLSRDRLVEQCWGGRIVGDDTLNRCILALRHLAKEFLPAPFTIETVRGVGYCLTEPSQTEAATGWHLSRRRVRLTAVGLVVAGLIGIGAAAGWQRFAPVDDEPVSIAVLPFRSLSAGDPYFAEGISEEILGQLGREQQFRVAGRTSSSQFGTDPDIQEVARRLDVDYVIEGSVRRQADRVRVNAALIRASDSTQLWSDSYDGTLDDIFDIQQRIGGAIAGSLQRKLARGPASVAAITTDAKTYELYLAGRTLLRTRSRRVGRTAVGILRDATNIDPDYAPAWASLASAVELDSSLGGSDGLSASRPLARSYARRALRLAPDLAQAHRALGTAAEYGGPEFFSHLRKAAQLDPGDAENLIWLGVAQNAEGSFDQELATYRRAFAIDPLWFRTTAQLAIALAERGRRREAEAIAREGMASDPINRRILLGRIAWILDDSSVAVREWSVVARANSPRWSGTAQHRLDDVKFALGLQDHPGERAPRAPDMRHLGQVWMDAAPNRSTWLAHNRNLDAAEVYRSENCVAAKLMLGAGRADELLAAYDGPIGLLSLRSGRPLRADQLREAPVVALALRQAGRAAEADRLLRDADNLARSIQNRETTPFWFDADAAAVWAVSGRPGAALTMLENARQRGWTHTDTADLRDLADEPAFRSLRNNPRFERLRADLRAHRLRERAETEHLGI